MKVLMTKDAKGGLKAGKVYDLRDGYALALISRNEATDMSSVTETPAPEPPVISEGGFAIPEEVGRAVKESLDEHGQFPPPSSRIVTEDLADE